MLTVVIPTAETDLTTTDIFTSRQLFWSWFQQMFLTILSPEISVQLLFSLNAPFDLCCEGCWDRDDMVPNSSNMEHQIVSVEKEICFERYNCMLAVCRSTKDLGHCLDSLLLPIWAAGFVW